MGGGGGIGGIVLGIEEEEAFTYVERDSLIELFIYRVIHRVSY